MNRLSKGLLVGGLGAALLIGGGGTLALWNVAAQSQAGQLALGNLNLTVPENGRAWHVLVAGEWEEVEDISTLRLVPGDSVRLTQPLAVTLTGDRMKADLSIDVASAFTEGVTDGGTAEDFLDISTAFLPGGGATLPVADPENPNVWRFGSAINGGTATFTQQVTFTFNPENAKDRVGVLSTVDLSKTDFVLEQVFENSAS
ncbi:alternate-type signal peptide domain-containing protein [Lysinibacter sp. HNR]|uniref:alternate-type signal peptide domain-containing protein n=1 Tax=Lysinibacter sp. HNR TaxID=3031408 RepID=UPI0024356297|nr:alternate-type signal peptide domain-containing protein [Lysinibacter sp. HNR]WGD37943.1 alternate-type signal peptide domain-containing protein [Lysinibacter sp. HNR]